MFLVIEFEDECQTIINDSSVCETIEEVEETLNNKESLNPMNPNNCKVYHIDLDGDHIPIVKKKYYKYTISDNN
jgi:hypothetical protein